MKKKYWIAFSSIEQIDSSFILKLYDYFGDIEQAFQASLNDLKNIDGLDIKAEYVTEYNEHGNRTRYAVYSLRKVREY